MNYHIQSNQKKIVFYKSSKRCRCRRGTLIRQEAIVRRRESKIFTDDCIFSSPSTAASIVLGRNANGLTEWKLKDGTSLKEYESSQK